MLQQSKRQAYTSVHYYDLKYAAILEQICIFFLLRAIREPDDIPVAFSCCMMNAISKRSIRRTRNRSVKFAASSESMILHLYDNFKSIATRKSRRQKMDAFIATIVV